MNMAREQCFFSVPILFIIFNRPEETARVFSAIRQIRPKKLFIAADGPRYHKVGEVELCQRTRDIALAVDWPCTVVTLFRTENLGCGKGVSSAITWFFKQVEEGIILEDDCIPHESFFLYCAKLLEKYRHDECIMMITGTSFLSEKKDCIKEQSYFFSRYYNIWGWATWKRAWLEYDYAMQSWPLVKKQRLLFKMYPANIAQQCEKNYDMAFEQKVDTWDYQWSYACIKKRGYAITPCFNLISNIGYIGTHLNSPRDNPHLGMMTYEMLFVNHPKEVIYKQEFDFNQWYFLGLLERQNYGKKMINFIKRCLRFLKKKIISLCG